MDTRTHTPPPTRQPLPPQAAPVTSHDDHDDPHPSLMDGFHLPPTVAERRALRHAAQVLVGPGGG